MSAYKNPDIDIDVEKRDVVLELFDHCAAAIHRVGKEAKHNTGIYPTKIPFDPRTNMATIDHKEAEELGYIKIDILNMSVYELVRDEAHLVELISTEPPWERLWTDKAFCEQIVHIGSYFKMLGDMKPDSIPRMAMFISVIRPGKKHLQGKLWAEIAETVWDKTEDDSYYFKHSHAISYAELVRVHMNLVNEK